MSDPNDFAARLLAATGAHAFERDDGGGFTALGQAPTVLRRVVERAAKDVDGHDFLGSFLQRAEEAWAGEGRPPLESGPWHEDVPGRTWTLEATALRSDGRRILILREAAAAHASRQQLLQGAREALLESERLTREMQLRDLLLHAIVHDLGGPLTALQASLHLLRDPELGSAERAELHDILSRSVTRLREMQTEVLSGFREELRTLEPSPVSSPAGPPDLKACAVRVVDALRPAAREQSVELRLERPEGPGPWTSTGEASRLERVLVNLIENALRHAPPSSLIRVKISGDDRSLVATVEDTGPGVPPELAPNLFLRGTQGGTRAGSSGLGLYFVRLTIERWGGTVGYRPLNEIRRFGIVAGHGAHVGRGLPLPNAVDAASAGDPQSERPHCTRPVATRASTSEARDGEDQGSRIPAPAEHRSTVLDGRGHLLHRDRAGLRASDCSSRDAAFPAAGPGWASGPTSRQRFAQGGCRPPTSAVRAGRRVA